MAHIRLDARGVPPGPHKGAKGSGECTLWAHMRTLAVLIPSPLPCCCCTSQVHPQDPGYNLRPEHVESTYMLHCLTGSDLYLDIASKLQETLQKHNRVKCGFASIVHVDTGERKCGHRCEEEFKQVGGSPWAE